MKMVSQGLHKSKDCWFKEVSINNGYKTPYCNCCIGSKGEEEDLPNFPGVKKSTGKQEEGQGDENSKEGS